MCGLKQRALRTSVILAIIALTTALPCRAGIYGIVEGTVMDEWGNPLPGATIRITGTSQGAIAGADGRFRILKVVAGTCDLSVTNIGFETKEIYSLPVKPDETSRVAVEMWMVGVMSQKPYLSTRPAPIQLRSWINGTHPGPVKVQSNDERAALQHSGAALTGMHFRRADEMPVTRVVPLCDKQGFAILRHLMQFGVEQTAVPPRIEELVNTPRYNYAAPTGIDVKLYSEMTNCPWNADHYLLNIAVCTRNATNVERKTSGRDVHLIIDVSGSMQSDGKFERLKVQLEDYLRGVDAATAVGLHVLLDGQVQTVVSPRRTAQHDELRTMLDSLTFDQAKQKFSVFGLPKRLADAGDSGRDKRIVLLSDGADVFNPEQDAQFRRMLNALKELDATLDIISCGTLVTDNYHLSDQARRCGGRHHIADTPAELNAALDDVFKAERVPLLFNPLLDFDFNPRLVKSYRLLGCDVRGRAAWYYAPADSTAVFMPAGAQHVVQIELVPASNAAESLSVYTRTSLTERALDTDELASVRLSYSLKPAARRQNVELIVTNEPTALKDASADFKLSAALACFGLYIVNAPNSHRTSLRMARELTASEPRAEPGSIHTLREEVVECILSNFGRRYNRTSIQFER